jgi:hypothetical protein
VGVAFPYGLGALIPLAGILVGIGDIENTTTGPAIAGAFVTMLLALAINEPITALLYFVAVLVGFLTVSDRYL